jgi:phosphoglycerol geranylgeranyltransferase
VTVEDKLLRQLSTEGLLCFALIDSEGINPTEAAKISKFCQQAGCAAILVGGSTAVDQFELDEVVKSIKAVVTLPVILFPGNVTGVAPSADAIFFSSLLNSDNPYFITEAQALGAIAIRKYELEAIPMGYIIVGEGGATGFVGRARGIPPTKPALAAMYALAAQYMGMRWLYLEAGSGVTSHVSPSLVAAVRASYNGKLIVGGGVRDADSALEIVQAGADAIVIGTLLEQEGFESTLTEIVSSLRSKQRQPSVAAKKQITQS